MVGLPEQLSKDKRTQYFYSNNNWDESISEFWSEALKKWCLVNEKISFSFSTVFQEYTIGVKGFPGLLIPETLPVALDEILLEDFDNSSSSSSSTGAFSRQTLEYKLVLEELISKKFDYSTTFYEKIVNQIIEIFKFPIYSRKNENKDWKSAKLRQLKLDKSSKIICISLLEDLAKILSIYMSSKSSKDRTIFFRKPSGYKTRRTLSQMLINCSNEGNIDISLSRLFKCIANRLDNAISDEGERLVDMLCKLQLIQITHEKFNNFASLSSQTKYWYIRFIDNDRFNFNENNGKDVSPIHVAELNLMVNIDFFNTSILSNYKKKNILLTENIKKYGTEDNQKWPNTARMDVIHLDKEIKKQMKKKLLLKSLPEYSIVLEQLKEDELFAEELLLQKSVLDSNMKENFNFYKNNENSNFMKLKTNEFQDTIDSVSEQRSEFEDILIDNDITLDDLKNDLSINIQNCLLEKENDNIFLEAEEEIETEIQTEIETLPNSNFRITSNSNSIFRNSKEEKINFKKNIDDSNINPYAYTADTDINSNYNRHNDNYKIIDIDSMMNSGKITPSRPISDTVFNFESMTEQLPISPSTTISKNKEKQKSNQGQEEVLMF